MLNMVCLLQSNTQFLASFKYSLQIDILGIYQQLNVAPRILLRWCFFFSAIQLLLLVSELYPTAICNLKLCRRFHLHLNGAKLKRKNILTTTYFWEGRKTWPRCVVMLGRFAAASSSESWASCKPSREMGWIMNGHWHHPRTLKAQHLLP